MILADNGSNFFFSGASYAVDANSQFTLTWNDNDIQSSTRGLKALRYSDFEVVDLTPAVTGLSAAAGAVGDTITVTGRNFAGAAGRLQVFFGTTASSSVIFWTTLIFWCACRREREASTSAYNRESPHPPTPRTSNTPF